MKGVWVASVYNLDYPKLPTTDAETLRKEADTILDNVYNMGLNAVFLQVRPSSDALYTVSTNGLAITSLFANTISFISIILSCNIVL